MLASFLRHPLSSFWVTNELRASCYERKSPQWHHLNLAASQRNAGSAVLCPMAAGLPLLSSWDNTALENTTRNSYVTRHEFPAHAGKTLQPFATNHRSKVQKKGESSDTTNGCKNYIFIEVETKRVI